MLEIMIFVRDALLAFFLAWVGLTDETSVQPVRESAVSATLHSCNS